MKDFPYCTAILVAAGQGKRMGIQMSKQFIPICGKEILAWTVDTFEKSPYIQKIIIMASQDGFSDILSMCKKYGWKKIQSVAIGGKERQDSVSNGLAELDEKTEIVVIHDAVRPFVTDEMIGNSIEAAMTYGSAVIGVPAKDTIKVCNVEDIAIQTPDRNTLWQIQTPQTFQKNIIVPAYENAAKSGFVGTDDASVVEFAGNRVKVILGSYRNIKITTPEDLCIAKAFLEETQA